MSKYSFKKMSFECVLVIIVSFNICKPEEINNNFCNDIKYVYKLNEKIINLPQLNIDNENLEQHTFTLQFFDNKTETLLSKKFKEMYEKLVDVRNTQLTEDIRRLRNGMPLSPEYVFLNTIFKTRENKIPNNFTQEVVYSDDLKKQAKYLICAFFTLGNFTNNYDLIKELLQPLEIILEDEQSSLAILIFINKFLIKAIQGTSINIYRNLFMEYVINQLQTVDSAFNISDLLILQNKSDLELRNFSKNLQPEGIFSLALNWRFKVQNVLAGNGTSEYLHKIDQTLLEVSKRNNKEIDVVQNRLNNFGNQIYYGQKHFKKDNPRIKKLRSQVDDITSKPGVTPRLVKFAKEFMKKISASETNVMEIIYKYVSQELNAIEPFNASVFKSIHEMKMEELAPILQESLTNDPQSITTMALDWVFQLKIELLTKTNIDSNIFDILRNTLNVAKERRVKRQGRTKTIVQNGQFTKLHLAPDPREFDTSDLDLLEKLTQF